jgi:predicted metal-binding membrane protein
MWAVMMVGMMMPSTAPMMLLYARVYGWFSEGLETRDLVAARELLLKLTQSR